MAVLVCGNINTDIIMKVSHFPSFHEKILADSYFYEQGGAGANTCWWLSRLGTKCKIIGCVGRDVGAKNAVDDLISAGADTSLVQTVDEATGVAVVFSAGQDKRMVKYPGANLLLNISHISAEGLTHIHMSSVSRDVATILCNMAHRHNVPISWDPSENLYPELLDNVTYLFINEDDYSRKEGIIKNSHVAHIIKTLNEGGCILDSDIRIPSIGKEAIDTTGAGDAFDAGFIHALEQGMDMERCLITGVVCAGKNIRAIGARKGFDSLKEISKDVEEHLRDLHASYR